MILIEPAPQAVGCVGHRLRLEKPGSCCGGIADQGFLVGPLLGCHCLYEFAKMHIGSKGCPMGRMLNVLVATRVC